MNRRIMQKWVRALRSGRYLQTTSVLKDNKGYCCLGVLADLYPATIAEKVEDVLPKEVADWAEMRTVNGELFRPVDGQDFDDLVHLNDHSGLGFDAIADVIEAQYKDL